MIHFSRRWPCLVALLPALTLFGCRSSQPTAEAPPPSTGSVRAVQPGAPGQPSRALTASELATDVRPKYTRADVEFMQGMIGHHAQALEMTALVEERTTRPDLRMLARRIDVSQRDEILLMQTWLRDRGEMAPQASSHAMHHGHGAGHGAGHLMPGMLSPEQMEQLKASTGDGFYRLFLEFMIVHHEGALTMVETLFASAGAGQDTDVYRFAADVDVDQRMEIDRMQQMLDALR